MGARRGVSVHEAAGEPAGQLAPAVELGAGVAVHEAVCVSQDAAALLRILTQPI